MGAIIGDSSYTSLASQSLVFQRELTSRISAEIYRFIADREQELLLYRDLIATRPEIEDKHSLLAGLFSGKRNDLQDVSLLAANGREVAFVSRSATHSQKGNIDLSGEAVFIYPAASGQSYIGPIYFDEELREPLLDVAVPIIDLRSGNLTGVLSATIRVKSMWALLASLELPEGVEVFVVNANRQIVAHRNPSLALRQERYRPQLEEGRSTGQNGNEAFIAFDTIRLGDNRLDIVAEHDLSLALKTANDQMKITAAITLVVLVLVVIATMRVAKIVLQPISTLTDAAEKIQLGEFSEIPGDSGLREVDVLSGKFNDMSRKLRNNIDELKARKREADATTQQLAAIKENLEQQVQARTGELAESVQKLQREADERRRMSVELENKNAELERFSYTVSHDLKSPLVTIEGFVELVRRDISDQKWERIDKDLDKIHDAANAMKNLVDDLLELSRAGQTIGERSECRLDDIARQAATALTAKIEARGIKLEIENMPSVHADASRLREVFQNLIENAIKYMGEQPAPRVRIGAIQNDAMLDCFVTDNGIGIESSSQDKIFGLFHRVNSETDGTGVGLAVVKRIVEVHGGKVWVESEGAGKGSSLWFSLPMST